MSDYAERVAAGAVWLDHNVPGWAERVTLGGLQMSRGCRCVLGYVFRVDAEAADAGDGFTFASEEYGRGNPGDWAERLGFDVPLGLEHHYPRLQALWKKEIEKRRSAA